MVLYLDYERKNGLMKLIPRDFYLDDIFDDFAPSKHNEMKCDIYEKDNKYHLEMDVPGFDKNDISVECNNGYVTITAEKKSENNEEDEDKNFIRRERCYGKFQRSFNFGEIDEENIKAEFKNGTLKLCIPKMTVDKSKKLIQID